MSRARLVLYFFNMVSRRNNAESLRAIWLFLRKEERTGMLSDKMQRRSMQRKEDAVEMNQPGDLILESLMEDWQASAQLLL